MIRFLTFGVLCGATAAVMTFSAGGGVVLSLAAYGLVGSVGLLIMAGIGRIRRRPSQVDDVRPGLNGDRVGTGNR